MATEDMPLLLDWKLGAVPPHDTTPIPEQNATHPPLFSTSANHLSGPIPGSSPGLPQTIAHRGYKALLPENTMGAFEGAVAVGAHAIETDLHLSRDGVVVLSHDATLKRCFGRSDRIADCDWAELRTLKTLREPKGHMPRLVDLLEYLARPGMEDIWLLLDIKTDDSAPDLLAKLSSALASVATPRPWAERVVLGCWNESYITLCRSVLPGFRVAYIGFSWLYALRFLRVPKVHFNMLQKSLVGPAGARFMRAVRRKGRALLVWTVNDEEWMEWSIRKGVDGVITDDPKLFLDVCERFRNGEGEGGDDKARRVGRVVTSTKGRRAKLYLEAAVVQALGLVFSLLFWFSKNPLRKGTEVGAKKR